MHLISFSLGRINGWEDSNDGERRVWGRLAGKPGPSVGRTSGAPLCYARSKAHPLPSITRAFTGWPVLWKGVAMGYLVQLGTYNPLMDSFTLTLDCNDGINLEVEEMDGLVMPPPALDVYAANNPRVPGDRVTGANYGPRVIRLSLIAGPAASYASMQVILQKLWGVQEAARVARISAAAGVIASARVALLLQPPGSTTPVYADVLAMSHDLPSVGDTAAWVQLRHDGIGVELLCAPFLRGSLVTLQNLVSNPGFEAPSQAGAVVFNDALANFNAYAVRAGGSLTQDKFMYADAVLADQPVRYYRLDEISGTTFYDAMASGNNGAITGGVTVGATGLLTGDGDKAATFNGSSGYASCPTTGLPSGNSAFTIEGWFSRSGTPSVVGIVAFFGTGGTSSEYAFIGINGSNVIYGSAGTKTITSSTTAAINTVYHVVLTYDGTTATLYINGTSAGSTSSGTVAISLSNMTIGSINAGDYFPGTLDEVAIYGSALPAARVSAHYAAGTTAPSATANTMQIPSGGRVAFGSPAWGTVNMWAARWRFVTGLTATFYLHYTDANDSVAAQITGTQVALVQVVGGTTYTLSSANVNLTNGMQYWVQATQFPGFGQPPLVTVTLLADGGGVPGAMVATVGPVPTHDAVTALAGQPQIAASGAVLGLGGNFSNVYVAKLFGPGGWSFVSAGTGVASGAWEQTAANTYPNGPAQSFGTARVDVAPAGTLNAQWVAANVASPALVMQTAQPVKNAGDVLGVSAMVKSTGVGSGCAQSLLVNEYDANGNYLRQGTVSGGVTGPQASWAALAGGYTTGANCAYVALVCSAVDGTSGSAGGTVWWDNAQVWDQTATGMTAMPYCELAFPAAPAQLLVSGVQGDVPAPCQIAFGILPAGAGLAASGSLTLYAGRRAISGFGAQLVGGALQGQQDGVNQKMFLDATCWDGIRAEHHNAAGNYQPLFVSDLVRDLLGTYHLLTRLRMVDTPSANQNLYAQAYLLQHAWLGNSNKLDRLGIAGPPAVFPFTGTAWQLADAGLLAVPPFPTATMGDPSQVYATIAAQSSTAVNEMDDDWGMLLPVDGEVLSAVLQNNASGPTLAGWIWVYVDGLSLLSTAQAAAGWSLETTRLPNPAHAGGGPGTVGGATPALSSVGDAVPRVDPALSTVNGSQVSQGVNQWAVVVTDNVATVLPVAAQITYAPLYLQPR